MFSRRLRLGLVLSVLLGLSGCELNPQPDIPGSNVNGGPTAGRGTGGSSAVMSPGTGGSGGSDSQPTVGLGGQSSGAGGPPVSAAGGDTASEQGGQAAGGDSAGGDASGGAGDLVTAGAGGAP